MPRMSAVVKEGTGPGARLIERDIPSAGPGEVIIRVRAAAICGTDVHIYEWNRWAENAGIKLPIILGHECAGDVVEVGSGVNNLATGDRVAVDTHIPCGTCRLCQTGRQHICQNLKLFGVHTEGCFAQYARVPAACVRRLPREIAYEIGALFEPLGTALRGAQALEPAGKTVAVIGCGPIGLFALASLRALGAARTIAIDVSPARLELATKLGADFLVNPAQSNPVAALRALTDGYGVDAFIEASGNATAVRQAFQALMKGGRAALIGLPGRTLELDVGSDVVFKEATIFGIHGRLMFATWEIMQNLVVNGRLQVESVITQRLPLQDFAAGMELARSSSAGKVILLPWEGEQ
ncbi:MAG: threonine 3-dehydrogenase [Bacillota bacterium]|nr:threonine 3-dehydrogenase [Bacillota bacterium]MDK2855366.1 threonine 3-dehydrogenase [Bacillota bacterium]MDK2924500.1 threonine 3-dehydrogenase [Bacillota bacterium]